MVNVKNIIITTNCPTVSASTGVSYIKQLEALTISKIKNDSRTQYLIDINTEIFRWIHQREKNIIMGE